MHNGGAKRVRSEVLNKGEKWKEKQKRGEIT